LSARLDIVELGMLRRLGQGALWADGVTTDQHDTLIRLCARKLAVSVSVKQHHKFKRGGVFFAITDEGRERLNA